MIIKTLKEYKESVIDVATADDEDDLPNDEYDRLSELRQAISEFELEVYHLLLKQSHCYLCNPGLIKEANDFVIKKLRKKPNADI